MTGSAPSFDRLTSRSTLYEAFARVYDNHGCRGADGVTVEQFAANLEAELDHLQGALLRGSYRPFPLLRFQIPKATSGLRSLCVPTVRDRVLQSAVFLITRETFEAEFEDTSHAYRLGRSVRTAIHQIHRLRDQGYLWVVDADIDGFFDSIPHQPLLARLRRLGFDPRLDRLFTQWMQAEVYDGRRIFRLTRGVPQGAVVSPLLANLFLDELDENLALFGRTAVRYADDFVVLCKSAEDAGEALELTDYLLAELQLHLNREKTRTTSFEQGFQFLGAFFLEASTFLPFDRPKPERTPPALPPPLDLLTYLELREEVHP
jgi:group II intron reverse transcriptase/maturase